MFSFSPKLFVLLLLIIYACGSDTSDLSRHGELFEEVVKTDKGLLRGIELGMSVEQVKEKEAVPPSEEDSNYIYYDLYLGNDTTSSLTLAYTFDTAGLATMEAEVYFSSDEHKVQLMDAFEKYLSEKYGDGAKEKGYITWKGRSGAKNIAISLGDESESAGTHLLSLSIYPLD